MNSILFLSKMTDDSTDPPPKMPKRKGSSGQLNQLDDSSVTIGTGELTTSEQDVGMDVKHQRRVSVNEWLPNTTTKRLLHRDSASAFLHDLYDDLNSHVQCKSREYWKAFFETYHSLNYIMVRPHGKSMQSSDLIDMLCGEQVQLQSTQLVSIDSVVILAGGLSAEVNCTVDQRYTYQGLLTEDHVSITCVLEELNGSVRICREHQTQAVPRGSRWDPKCSSQRRHSDKEKHTSNHR